MKVINKIIIALCAVAAVLVIAAIAMFFAKGSYPFVTAKWHDEPQRVLDSLGLSMSDVTINSNGSNDVATDQKSLISYEAKDFVWENIKGDLFLTFSDNGLIWVEFRSPLASVNTATTVLTRKHGNPNVDDVGNSVWGKQMGSGNGVTLFSSGDMIYINFYVG